VNPRLSQGNIWNRNRDGSNIFFSENKKDRKHCAIETMQSKSSIPIVNSTIPVSLQLILPIVLLRKFGPESSKKNQHKSQGDNHFLKGKFSYKMGIWELEVPMQRHGEDTKEEPGNPLPSNSVMGLMSIKRKPKSNFKKYHK
jgi:hypothetical protein